MMNSCTGRIVESGSKSPCEGPKSSDEVVTGHGLDLSENDEGNDERFLGLDFTKGDLLGDFL